MFPWHSNDVSIYLILCPFFLTWMMPCSLRYTSMNRSSLGFCSLGGLSSSSSMIKVMFWSMLNSVEAEESPDDGPLMVQVNWKGILVLNSRSRRAAVDSSPEWWSSIPIPARMNWRFPKWRWLWNGFNVQKIRFFYKIHIIWLLCSV